MAVGRSNLQQARCLFRCFFLCSITHIHRTVILLQIIPSTMSLIGSKYIKVKSKSPNNRHSCICGSDDCGKLTTCFQSLEDVRGCMFTMPVLDGKRNSDMKEHKLKRVCHHLGLGATNYRDYATTDKRDQGASTPSPSSKSTRRKKKETKRERSYVAAHHFHPMIVRYMVNNETVRFMDYVPESIIQSADLIEKGYTDIDIFKITVTNEDGSAEKKPHLLKVNGVMEKVYAPTPSYKDAWGDYQLVATRCQINDIIKKYNDATYGHSFLGSRDDGVPEPVHKMAKPSVDDPDDLRHAVCVLSDELTDLRIEIKNLKEQLEKEKTRNNNAPIEQYVQGQKNGLTRLNISSDKYHKGNPNVAKLYFKFQDTAKGSMLSCWDVTKQFLKDMFDVDHEEPTIDKIQHVSGRAKKLTEFETCLVALIFFQNGYDHEFIASIFGCTRHLVGRCIKIK
jgi:regulator of replication initiation timing